MLKSFMLLLLFSGQESSSAADAASDDDDDEEGSCGFEVANKVECCFFIILSKVVEEGRLYEPIPQLGGMDMILLLFPLRKPKAIVVLTIDEP